MKWSTIVGRIGTPSSWRDAVRAIRETHGRGASRWLADRFGVSQRTAQRWIKGEQEPSARGGRRAEVERAADPRKVAAARLRGAQMIGVGRVKVRYGARDEGLRNVGTLRVDETMRAELDRAADAIERGDQAEAERIMSAAILGGYGAQRARDGRDVVRAQLEIGDYRDGMVIA